MGFVAPLCCAMQWPRSQISTSFSWTTTSTVSRTCRCGTLYRIVSISTKQSALTRRVKRRVRTARGRAGRGRRASRSSRSKRLLGCSLVVPWIRSIGDLDHPPSQVRLQNLEGSERATGQCVVLDVADSPFDLPLGSSATRTTGLGCQASVPAERLESWIPDHLAGLAIVRGHQGRGVVAEDLLGEAAEVSEGSFEALEPVVLSLGKEGPAIKPAGVSQHGGHQVDLHGLTGDPHDLLAEVDLDLLTRRGLEPDRGQGLGPLLLAEGADGPLQGPQSRRGSLDGPVPAE